MSLAPVSELWSALRGVHRFRYVARGDRPPGWNGTGDGTVAIESPSPEVLLFREAGVWRPVSGSPLQSSNVYRWTALDSGSVRLEHLRFGEGRPVYLFDLVPSDDGEWVSAGPHVCSEDTYSARLRVCPVGFGLIWHICGPDKAITIDYSYRVADDA